METSFGTEEVVMRRLGCSQKLRAKAVASLFMGALTTGAFAQSGAPQETPLSMVNALHTAFGEHHARAVHTKGVVVEGTFTPAPEARTLTKAPVFAGGPRPIIARFSLFAGVPTLPDTDDGASPAGFAFKIQAVDGDDFDVEANQHRDFITATFDEFAVFLRSVGAAGKGDKAPLNAFLASHPHAREFLATRTYPASYASAKYFGINALKFTNTAGRSVHVRYLFVPKVPERYLSPEERKAQAANYLNDEITTRVTAAPVSFDWFAQIAGPGDKVDDPSIAWPDRRRLVKLGTITLRGLPSDPEAVQRTLLFLPGQPHPGVEAADPMLVMRNTAYPISLGQRQ
jgi:catalase